MQRSSRLVSVVATAAVPLVLVTACGGEADGTASNNLTPITGSSYVTIEPATTTTTTTTLPTPVDQLEPGQTSPVEQTYTIQSGDSLSKIAQTYGVEMQVICTYNSWTDCIDPPHLLLPGDIIRIPPDSLVPGTGTGDTPTQTTVPPSSGGASSGCTHTIVSGDTPFGVASKYDLTYDQLQAANPGMDFTTTFVVGDVLTIPPEGTCD